MPYFNGTAKDLQAEIARSSQLAAKHFGELLLRKSRPDRDHFGVASQAVTYGNFAVALLGFIEERLGQEAFEEAAAMVDMIGMNGGNPYWGGA
jgi:hypothetical protein